MYGVSISYQFTVDNKLFAASKYRYDASMTSSGGDASKNPKGIPAQSPWLRGTSYPGLEDSIPSGLECV
jgi:hypothetical protein